MFSKLCRDVYLLHVATSQRGGFTPASQLKDFLNLGLAWTELDDDALVTTFCVEAGDMQGAVTVEFIAGVPDDTGIHSIVVLSMATAAGMRERLVVLDGCGYVDVSDCLAQRMRTACVI